MAVSQGPRDDSVARRREDQCGCGCTDGGTAASDSGTARASHSAVAALAPPSSHHQLRQPKAPIHSGPISSALAVASGM